jgi:hypothetical protein
MRLPLDASGIAYFLTCGFYANASLDIAHLDFHRLKSFFRNGARAHDLAGPKVYRDPEPSSDLGRPPDFNCRKPRHRARF